MTYVDVCTGIDAASVAWMALNWRCAAVAEIEPFPCMVLAERFGASRPEFMLDPAEASDDIERRDRSAAIRAVSRIPVTGKIPNRGDFTTIVGDEYGAVDLLVGGTPCQDFSVAGLRAGMDGKRGQLTVEFAKLVHRLAAKARTRWVLWENVPGVLSIDGGEAFATFLGILAKRSVRVPEGGWANSGIIVGGNDSFGLAYRVCDAQHFGVPQRRRRVFVVGYFGDWRRAAAVLFERHSLSGDSAPRRETGQELTHSVTPSLTGSGRGVERTGESRGQDPVVPVYDRMRLPMSRTGRPDSSSSVLAGMPDPQLNAETESGMPDSRITICMATGQGSAEIGIGTTLNCNHEAPIVTHVTPPLTSNPYGDHESREGLLVTHSLRGEGFDASEDGTGRGTPLVPVVSNTLKGNRGDKGGGISPEETLIPISIQAGSVRENPNSGPDGIGVRTDGIAYTLEARAEVQAVGFMPARSLAKDGEVDSRYAERDVCDALHTGSGQGNKAPLIAFSSKNHGADAGEISPTLRSMSHNGSHANGGGQVAIAFSNVSDGSSARNATEICNPLTTRHGDPGMCAYPVAFQEAQTGVREYSEAGTLRAGGPGHDPVGTRLRIGMAVRRLTPRECERLQGFSDDFTKISDKTADGPRYKALGNSMAVPVMRWLGERIQMVEDLCNQKGEVIHGEAE